MTLQETIAKVIADAASNKKALSPAEIATIINHKKLYQRKDGKLLTAEHILAKINETQDRYEMIEGKVCFDPSYTGLANIIIDLAVDNAYRILYAPPVLQVLRKDEAFDLILLLAVYERLKSYEVTAEHLKFLKEDNKEELVADLNILAYELPQLKVFFSTFAKLLNQLSKSAFEAVMKGRHFVVGESTIDNKTFLDILLGRHGSLLINLASNLSQTSMYLLPEAVFSAVEKAEVQTLTVAYNANVVIAHALLSTIHLKELTCLYRDPQQTVYLEVLAFFSAKKLTYQIELLDSDDDEFYQNTLYCGPYRHKPDFEHLAATSSLSKSLREWLYVNRLLQSTVPNGTVFALLPSQRLSESASEKIRKQLIENYHLEQVTQLETKIQRREVGLEIRQPTSFLQIENKKPQADAITLAKPMLVQEAMINETGDPLQTEYYETYRLKIESIVIDEISSNKYRLLPSQYIHEAKESLVAYMQSLPVHYVKQIGDIIQDNFSGSKHKLSLSAFADDKIIVVSTGGNKLNAALLKAGENVSISQTLLIPNESIMQAEYLVLQLNNAYSQTQFEMRSTESVAISSITIEDLLQIKLSVPPLEEQRRILWEVEGRNSQSEQQLKTFKVDEFAMMNSLQHSITPSIGHIRTYVKSIKHYMTRQQQQGQLVDFSHFPIPAEMVDVDSDTVEETFSKIESITTSLEHSFEIMKAIATLDSTKLSLEEISIQEEIQQITHDLEDTQYIYVEGEDAKISVDRELFRELIKNLIYNSQKHAFKDNDERLIYFDIYRFLEDTEVASPTVAIEYWDNGKGLGKNFSWKNFIAYGRGDGVNRGTGLGGYLINRILELISNGNPRAQLLSPDQIKLVNINGKVTQTKTGFHIIMLLPINI